MMTPELPQTIRTPKDVAKAALIHDVSLAFLKMNWHWPSWCKTAGIDVDTEHGLRFSQADHALDAALSGAGVVLGRITLATRALESGRLVAPFNLAIVADAQFRFVCPKGHETRPNVKAFYDWVMNEIATSHQYEAGRTFVNAADV